MNLLFSYGPQTDNAYAEAGHKFLGVGEDKLGVEVHVFLKKDERFAPQFDTRKNVIFLDIDGVLNFVDMPEDEDMEHPLKYGKVNKKCVQTFLEFLEDIDGHIVISSTWRKDSLAKVTMKEVMEYFGVPAERYLGETPNLAGSVGSYRGNEIELWLRNNKDIVKTFLILDDDSDMLMWQADHYVHVNRHTGFDRLTAHIAKRVVQGTRYVR